nr:hypothetical protein [uncultured Roseateles sp.]
MLPSLAPELISPERRPFVKKLRNFIEDHGFGSVPILVIQCNSDDGVNLEIGSPRLAQALVHGAGAANYDEWWSAFCGGRSFSVFDGRASRHDSDEPLWVTEVHEDGHVLAAIRLLPYGNANAVSPGIVHAFSSFGNLVKKLYAATGVQGRLKVSCKAKFAS